MQWKDVSPIVETIKTRPFGLQQALLSEEKEKEKNKDFLKKKEISVKLELEKLKQISQLSMNEFPKL